MLIPRRLILIVPAVLCSRPVYAQDLNAADFACYMTKYAAGDSYANCDGVGGLTANDFLCFVNRYAAGDPYADCDGGSGWTNLALPAGAVAFYVAANGSDSNAGTQEAPFRTLRHALTRVRDGHPDQVLLRCGDTFNESGIDISKASGSLTSYMVIGSYGAGPRPRFAVNDSVLLGGQRSKSGLAIVDLHLEYTGNEQNKSSMFFADGWRHILVEGCYIAGWGDGIVMHEVGSGRLNDIKIRRNVIVDIKDTDGRCQGLFIGATDGLVVEENVFDYNGRASGPQTIFMHNVYLSETNGACVFNGNVSIRATSHGVQQRPGGQMVNNFFAENGINCFQGDSANVSNTLSNNVIIGGRDINSQDRRGAGFEIGGRGLVENNIAAHQELGTDAVTAFGFSGFDSGTVRGNFVLDWNAPGGQCWATAFQWEGGSGPIVVENNRVRMGPGVVMRHESRPLSGQFTYRSNEYWTTTPTAGCGGYGQFSTSSGVGVSWPVWQAAAGEVGTTFATMPEVNVRVSAYMTHLSLPGGLPEFAAECRKQSRQNWRPAFTADGFNSWVREQVQ